MDAAEFGNDYTKLIQRKDERATTVPIIVNYSDKAKKESNEGFGDEGDTRIALLCDTILVKISHWQNSKPKVGMDNWYTIYKVFDPIRYFFLVFLVLGIFFRYPNWCTELDTKIRDNCKH